MPDSWSGVEVAVLMITWSIVEAHISLFDFLSCLKLITIYARVYFSLRHPILTAWPDSDVTFYARSLHRILNNIASRITYSPLLIFIVMNISCDNIKTLIICIDISEVWLLSTDMCGSSIDRKLSRHLPLWFRPICLSWTLRSTYCYWNHNR